MSKRDLLLRVAVDAMNWGEGADFEIGELIGEFSPASAIKEHYGDQFPAYFNYNDDDEEDDDGYDEYEKQRNGLHSKISADVIELLYSLMDEPKDD